MEKPVTQARAELADLVNRVAYTGARVALTRRGKVMAALVSAEDLELLERLDAERVDVNQIFPVADRQDPPPVHEARPQPLRVAAEYRPPGPPPRPGFGR